MRTKSQTISKNTHNKNVVALAIHYNVGDVTKLENYSYLLEQLLLLKNSVSTDG
jgi:hypothetical protein